MLHCDLFYDNESLYLYFIPNMNEEILVKVFQITYFKVLSVLY